MDIYGYLHLVKMYRENIIFRENNNGLISLSERAELDREIREQAKEIDLAGMRFRDMSCDDCVNYNKCTMSRNPNFKCFEYESTRRG